MKYGERLSNQTKPEWGEKRLNYEALKAILDAGPKTREVEFDEKARRFFGRCRVELEKIETFFKQKIVESDGRCKALETYTRSLYLGTPSPRPEPTTPTAIEEPIQSHGRGETFWKKFVTAIERRFAFSTTTTKATSTSKSDPQRFPPEAEQKLKAASEEFYYELQCVKQYREGNVTGFRKILKKYDKTRSSKRGEQWFQDKVQKTRFGTSMEIDRLCERVESFRIKLQHGDRKTAMEKLRVPSLSDRRNSWTSFFGGFSLATLTTILMTAAVLAAYSPGVQPPWVVVRLCRGTCLLLLSAALTALNMYHWHHTGVNYVLIMELDPRRHVTSEKLFAAVTSFASIWALGVIGYIASPWLGLPRLAFPLCSTIVLVLMMVNPLNCFIRSSRYWLLGRIGRCLAAPFCNGSFFDFWLADQMCSLAPFFVDTYYFVCFYATEVSYVNGTMSFKISNETAALPLDDDFDYDKEFGIDLQTGKDFCSSESYAIRSTIQALPTLIRLAQCLRRFWFAKELFPHFYNSGKYTAGLPVFVFGWLFKNYHHAHATQESKGSDSPFFHFWMAALAISFGYTFLWDVRVDWRLLHTSANGGLRKKLIYKSIWPYYAAIVVDAVTRLLWIVQISVVHTHWDTIHPEILTTALALVELLRRCLWNAFRLENEHVNNVEGLRVSRNMFHVPFKKHLKDFGKLVNRARPRDNSGGEMATKKTDDASTRSTEPASTPKRTRS